MQVNRRVVSLGETSHNGHLFSTVLSMVDMRDIKLRLKPDLSLESSQRNFLGNFSSAELISGGGNCRTLLGSYDWRVSSTALVCRDLRACL